MIEKVKQIILDFQEVELKTGILRRLKIKRVVGKATVMVGVRRCGKTTYLYQVMERLSVEGVSRKNMLYVDFFDDRLHNLSQEGIGLITEAYYSIYPEKKNSEKAYYFFDEIQMVEGWESYVSRLLRSENCEIFLTGSSSRMLSKEIATQMRGRSLSWELFPFSFVEFLDAVGINGEAPYSGKKRLMIQKAFDEYWEKGGFPEVMNADRMLRVKIHQEYFQTVLFRDIIERHDASHPRGVTDLAHRLIDNIASLYSVNSLTGYLKTLGHKVSKSAVSDCMEWFEDAYFLFTVWIFDASLARRKTNPKKIYCIDHAFALSCASGILINSGHLFENLVFTALRRLSSDIYYYKTKSGREVDFIVILPDRTRMLVQACESMVEPQTRKRETTALKEAMAELGMDSGIIVTRREEDEIEIEYGKIAVMPVWRFLLNFESGRL